MAALVETPQPLSSSVFDKLVCDIVAGRYLPGTRLPAERDLARALGASRPTLREALRRLGEWGMIEARRSSGVVVREPREWTFDVLPAYMRFGAPIRGVETIVRLLKDLLETRRLLYVNVLRMVAPRIPAGSLGAARAALARAWAARQDTAGFLHEDFELVRSITEAAEFLPALWMLNSLAGTYLEFGRTMMGSPSMVPDDYVTTYEVVFAALEKNDADTACKAMSRYLEHYDQRVLAAFSIA
ncbi:MAG TPA: GntR family transcriptional regulator [Haliangiales bacterium]|nr:GntR family transcriptional regulator [Haliangiales bacterium]